MLWLMRGLAVGHFVWGLLLVLFAAHMTRLAFSVFSNMSAGTGRTNLAMGLIILLPQVLVPASLGAWMLILGRCVWIDAHHVCKKLFLTHGILLLVGILNIIIGVHAVRAAEISTAHGGGILSPLAWFPLIFGVCVTALALPSIVLALVRYQKSSNPTTDSKKLVKQE